MSASIRSPGLDPVLAIRLPTSGEMLHPKERITIMTTVITVFDVPAAAGAPPLLGAGHVRHQAVGAPASFPWVDLAESLSAEAATAAVARASAVPGALTGRYDAFHVNDQAAPRFHSATQTDAVVFVNCLRFEPAQHDAAFAAWQRVNSYMVDKPGYRGHRLHRRIDDGAPFGLVNVVEWESPAAWRAAHDTGFHALTEGELPFTAYPTLCRPVAATGRLQMAG